MKHFLKVFVVLVLLGFVLPVANLIEGHPHNALAERTADDPDTARVVALLANKCGVCHTREHDMPFYASFPIAKGVMEADAEQGLAWLDYEASLFPGEGLPPSEVGLAKTERVLEDGTMPPFTFLLVHWDGHLTDEDKTTLRDWVARVRREHYATGEAAERFANEPVQPIPSVIEIDPQKAALGERLFFDKRLSKDDTLSCASCHGLDRGGTDQARYSTGVDGRVGGINAPTVFNSAYLFSLFWDGRASSLEEQADGPVNNPIEMASNWDEVILKLEKDPEMTAAFRAVYPDGYDKDHFLDAIATFERTLLTPDAPFDLYLKGQEDAVSERTRHGYTLFKATGCATCHVGAALGGQSYEPMGRTADYFADRGDALTDADLGRFGVTKAEGDKHRFRVPILRNIARTAPYFHDGSATDLADAVRTMAKYQVDEDLSGEEVARIVAFLESLTGTWNGKPL